MPKLPPNCSENRVPPRNPIKLQKQAFQILRTQNFAKCRKMAFVLDTQVFQIGTWAESLHKASKRKLTFSYKGNILSNRAHAQLAVAQFRLVLLKKDRALAL